MATVFLSDQEAARTGSGAAPPKRLRAHEAGGKLSTVLFRCALPMSGLAVGDTISLCAVPAGVALISALAVWDRRQAGMTSLGLDAAPGKYGAGFADRFAEWYIPPPVLDVEQRIIATNTGAPWTPGSVLVGHFTYVGA